MRTCVIYFMYDCVIILGCSCDPDETCSINGDCFCGEDKVRQNGSCVDCEPSPGKRIHLFIT